MHSLNKAKKRRDTDHHEPIPVGEVQEADWSTWAQTAGFADSQPMDFQITEKLPIAQLVEESICAFASVTKKGH